MEKLIKSWRDRASFMLTYAEIAHWDGNEGKQQHLETCARQWYNAIIELEEFIKESNHGESS